MTIEHCIELLYFATGIALPIFYAPQITRLLNDNTKAASFSLSKAMWQFFLRLPALLFAIVVVKSGFMIIVLLFDLAGRAGEIAAAVISLRRQGVDYNAIFARIHPVFKQGKVRSPDSNFGMSRYSDSSFLPSAFAKPVAASSVAKPLK